MIVLTLQGYITLKLHLLHHLYSYFQHYALETTKIVLTLMIDV